MYNSLFSPGGLSAILAALGFIGCSATGLRAQPANDYFSNRVSLAGTRITVTATNTAATREPGEPGESSLQHATLLRTLWWSWTAPADGVLAASVVGSGFNAALDVYTGETLPDLQLCHVSNCGQIGTRCMKASVSVSAGQTYQIVVGSEDDSAGMVSLSLAFLGRPPNDNFSQRIALGSNNVAVLGTNAAATVEVGEPLVSQFTRSIWFSWTAPSTGPVTIGVEAGPVNPEDSLFNTQTYYYCTALGVFTGDTLPTLALVTNRSDSATDVTWVLSQVCFQASAGTVYQIAVDGEVGTLGSLQLRVTRTRPPLVVLDSPPNGIEFRAGELVRAAAEAFAPDGRVNKVEFLLQNNYVTGGGVTPVLTQPFSTAWQNLSPGKYELTARATDDLGTEADSIPVNFDVRPVNDDFAQRIPFVGSFVTVTGMLANASSESGEPAANGSATVWWSWTAPASDSFTVTATSGYHPILSVFTGDRLSNLTAVASNRFDGLDPTYSTHVVFPAQAGTTYDIAVGTVGYGGRCKLSVAQTVPPTVTLTSPTNDASFVVGDLVSFEADATDLGGRIARVEFMLDDYELLGAVTNPPFRLTHSFTEGNISHRVRAWAIDDAGIATHSEPVWFEVRYPGPTNDNFADRIAFTGSFVTVTGSTAYATFEPGEASYVFSGSAWWVWTAPQSADFTVSVKSQLGYYPSIAVFTGSTFGTLNLLTNAAFLGSDASYSTRVVLHADAGTSYPIAIGAGAGISLSVVQSVPPNVTVISPTNHSQFLSGDLVTFEAAADDPDGTVQSVALILDDYCSLGVVTNSPFRISVVLTNAYSGERVRAWATDNAGLVTASAPVYFDVGYRVPPYPVAPNDNFTNRIGFTGTFVTVTGSTANATFELGEPIYVSKGSAWWAWTAPESGEYTLAVTSEFGYWPSMAVFTGSSLENLTLLTNAVFSGNDWSYSTRVVLQADTGMTYPIAVASGGNITLQVAKSLPPSVTITSPTNGATVLLGEIVNLVAGATDPDGSISRVTFYRDYGSRVLSSVTNSPFVLPLNTTNLFIGYNGIQASATDDRGLTTISPQVLLLVKYPPPVNDNFADRLKLSGMFLNAEANTLSATLEPGETTPPVFSEPGSVWWSWLAPASGRVALNSSQSPAFLGVYTGSALTNLVVIATNLAANSSPQLSFYAHAGIEYQIALVSGGGSSNPSQLSLFQDAREFSGPTLTNGAFSFQLISSPGRTWVIETGADLLHWTPTATGYCSDGVLRFFDNDAAARSPRFYRAVIGQ